jgi:hypothetical protein
MKARLFNVLLVVASLLVGIGSANAQGIYCRTTVTYDGNTGIVTAEGETQVDMTLSMADYFPTVELDFEGPLSPVGWATESDFTFLGDAYVYIDGDAADYGYGDYTASSIHWVDIEDTCWLDGPCDGYSVSMIPWQSAFGSFTASGTYGQAEIYYTGMSQLGETHNSVSTPVPTKLSLVKNEKTTYTGQSVINCRSETKAPQGWGYKRCVTYQVVDQAEKSIKQDNIPIHEDFDVVAFQNINVNAHYGDDSTQDGQILDTLAPFSEKAPGPQPGQSYKERQTLSTVVNGRTVKLRINCLDYQYDDVTITDVSNDPSQCK